MNKVLCVFLAVVFICSVFAYGTNKQFSVAVWIDNLLSIGEGVTIEDVAEVWQKDYYVVANQYKATEFLTRLTGVHDANGDKLSCKLAYNNDWELQTGGYIDEAETMYEEWDIVWMKLYDADGNQIENPYYSEKDVVKSGAVNRYYFEGYGTEAALRRATFEGAWPCIIEEQTIYFGWYSGDNEVLEGLDSVVETFDRLVMSGKLLGKAVGQVFTNVGKLLPWNATVEVM